MKGLALFGLSAILLAGTVNAQEFKRFTGSAGAGFTQPLGPAGAKLDTGWNIGGGFGMNFSPYFGALIDVNYNSLGINSTTLFQEGFPGGNVNVFSATLDPIFHIHPKGRLDAYIIGGGGMYRRLVEFTAPSISTFTGFDPFFGFFPVAVPTTQILSSYSVVKPGFDVGAGVALGTKWNGKFFAEARFNRMFLGSTHMDYIPVTFGFRF